MKTEKMYPLPLPGFLCVEEVPDRTETTTGIILLPGADKDIGTYQSHGIVKAVGTKRYHSDGTEIASEFKPGEEIYFEDSSSSLVKLDGHEYLLIAEQSVLVKIAPEEYTTHYD